MLYFYIYIYKYKLSLSPFSTRRGASGILDCHCHLSPSFVAFSSEVFRSKIWRLQKNIVSLHRQIPLASHKNSVPSGTFLFYEGMKYTKQAITTAEQISILRQRGLIVEDESQAREALDVISYFRLADYWRYMEADHTTHQFKENCHFSEILDYYYFDKELKALLFFRHPNH